MEDPRCPEHCYTCCLNPLQHHRFDANSHHLFALMTALCNTCGGVIFLTAPEGISHPDIDFDIFNKYLGQELLQSDFPKGIAEAYECDTAFWGVIVVKMSERRVPYSIGGNELNFQIDVHRRLHCRYLTVEIDDVFEDKQEELRKSTDTPSSIPSADESNLTSELPEAASSKLPTFEGVNELRWDRNKENWPAILEPADVSFRPSEIWKPSSPIRVMADIRLLNNLFQSDINCSEIIEKLKTNIPVFAIASRTWLSFLPDHDVESQPTFHLCDILTVSEDNEVCLWVIVSDSTYQAIQTQLQYMLAVGRTIKHQILSRKKKGPNLTIQCNLYSTDFHANNFIERHEKYVLVQTTYEMLYSKFHEETNSDHLHQCIASLILSNENEISICVGLELSFALSENQVRTMEANEQVTYVSAPPGTGKTLCGIVLYRKYRKQGSVYICPTKSLLQYLRYHGCDATLIQTDDQLNTRLKDGTFSNRKCVVIDESHHWQCNKESWRKLFMLMKKNPDMLLFVFGDNKFQSLDSRSPHEVADWIYQLSREILHTVPNIISFSEMYRNTKKLISFLQHTALGTGTTEMKVTYANNIDGDGLQCKEMEKLWENVPENGLVRYLRPLMGHTTSSGHTKYQSTDVAVLLDDGYADHRIGAMQQILQAQLPGITTHASDKFPREGIVVDRIENFIGLDAVRCVFLLSSKQRITEDPRYTIFLASRATHEAVFVVSKIDDPFAKCMKFDRLEVSNLIKCDNL